MIIKTPQKRLKKATRKLPILKEESAINMKKFMFIIVDEHTVIATKRKNISKSSEWETNL